MKKSKSKVDLGKGFKRIYYVLCAIWLFWIINWNIDYVDRCSPSYGYQLPLNCGKSGISLFIEAVIGFLVVVPIYYFIRWIVAGFKK